MTTYHRSGTLSGTNTLDTIIYGVDLRPTSPTP
jgi:hypothetical protein